jgi:hypothetical protein
MLHLSSLFGLAGVTYDYTTSNGTSSTSSTSGAAFAAVFIPVTLLVILLIVALWKVYKKAGRPGWAAIVPVYNTWVLFEITGFPGWWALLSLVPIVGLFPAVMSLVATFRLAKLFGKGDGFGLGLIFLPFIFFPILAFGKATFQGSAPVTTGSTDGAQPAASPEPTPVEPTAPEVPQQTPETTPAPVAPEAQPPQNDQQPPQTPTPPAV